MADVAGILERAVLGGEESALGGAWSAARTRAVDDGVAGWLYWHGVRGAWDMPADVEEAWQRVYRENAARNIIALERLSRCLAGWKEAGIEVLVLPGAPLLAHFRQTSELRVFTVPSPSPIVTSGSSISAALPVNDFL